MSKSSLIRNRVEPNGCDAAPAMPQAHSSRFAIQRSESSCSALKVRAISPCRCQKRSRATQRGLNSYTESAIIKAGSMSIAQQKLPVGPAKVPAALGEYALLTKLASGGMATVYLGRKRGAAGFERLVAIKVCHPHLREDDEFVSMFLDEARLAASIRHPNVVATLDVSLGEYLYLVMEYVEGFTLTEMIRKAGREKKPLPLPVVLNIMHDAMLGLHAAHELRGPDGQLLNLVHRDVSPHNILVGVDGVARITDFGIAFASARSSVTQEGRIKGKFAYLSPEQVKSKPATRRIDVFSAGIVFWEALTGRPLFRRPDDVSTINAVLKGAVLLPSSLVPGLPKQLDSLVLKALQRDPANRYATALEFAEAIEQLRVEALTPRQVGAHLESAFEKELGARREVIHAAAEQPFGETGTHLRRPDGTPSSGVSHGPVAAHPGALHADFDPSSPDGSPDYLLPPVEELEHRRLRGLLAAAMLLLVGGAVGILLARSAPASGSTAAPATPPAAAHSPSATSADAAGK